MTCKFFYLLLAAASLGIPELSKAAVAQVSTDTLSISPAASSAAVPTAIEPAATSNTDVEQQSNQFTITGGQLSDGSAPNLIHQFQQFDLGANDTANFVTSPDVANVISLINSLQPSAIDGLLEITSSNPNLASSANLFLVNPAGIIFGENVSLNLPADLTATTASALLFENTYLLSVDGAISEVALSSRNTTAADSLALSDLTGPPTGYLLLSIPDGTINGTNLPAGSIDNQGTLQVEPQANINLIAQYVQNDGELLAPGGTANLIAAAGDNLLQLSQPGNVLTLDVIPANTLEILSSAPGQSAIAALPSGDLPQLLTGGDEQNATQIKTDPDGSQSLTGSSLRPAPGTVLVRGTIDVSDDSPVTKPNTPGQVNILGHQINIIGGDIRADGIEQGGTVSIGGMPVLDNFRAAYVVVGRTASISSDASKGPGGTVQIWADDTVQFYGSATAAGADPTLDGSVIIDAGEQVDIRKYKSSASGTN
ncbi:MAG: filamentous hemagglutinin N-terminal domain-containing protein [Leptolyngbyaceae cyanobacterium]